MANPRSTLRLAAILGLIAAILAWSAVAVRYFTDATINWSTAAAGLFMAAMALGAWTRSRSETGAE